MRTRLVKINEHGRRIGESHPRAVLSDHEVGLLLDLLSEREQLLADMAEAPYKDVRSALIARGLSYRCLAEKFEVHKRTIGKIAQGERRCQTVVELRACP